MCAAEAEQLLSPFDISDLRCGVYHNVFSDYRIKILYKLLFFVSSSIKIIDKIEKTKVVRPSGPHRNVSKVSGRETEAVKVPAQRSGAACPTGAVTAGDWGWKDRISSRNPMDSGH